MVGIVGYGAVFGAGSIRATPTPYLARGHELGPRLHAIGPKIDFEGGL